MRHGNDMLGADHLLVREVGDIASDLAGGEGFEHSVVVHDLGTGFIDDAHAVLHFRERAGAQHMLRLIRIRDVHADVIGLHENLVQIHRVLHIAGQPPCGVHREIRVVAADVHAELHGDIRDQCADGAEADHAKSLSHQLRAGERRFALLNQLRDLRALPLQAAHPLDAAEHVARGHDHGAKNQLLDRLGVRAGRVEHNDAAVAAFVERDVIRASAGARNGKQALLKRIFMQIGAAQQQAIGIFNVLTHDTAALGQALNAALGDVVHCFDSVFIHGAPPQIASNSPQAHPRPPSASRYTVTPACRRPHGAP